MNSSLEHFKATIFRRKQRKEKQREKFNKENLDFISEQLSEVDFPKPSKVELEKVNNSFKEKINKHKVKEIIVYVLILLLFLALPQAFSLIIPCWLLFLLLLFSLRILLDSFFFPLLL